MSSSPRCARARLLPALLALLLLTLLVAAGCGESDEGAASDDSQPVLKISSIPDQDPQLLAERDGAMADHLAQALDVPVEYVPVTDYAASVSLLRTGDLDLVFFGGLTGVQARLQIPGVRLIAQRDIDDAFRSVFIANADAGIEPLSEVADLDAYEGKRFTFGSESSTSGRLMPEYFLDQAGIDSSADFAGEPGYSGSHDKTVDLVESGSFEGGALNLQVWEARQAAGSVDTGKVIEVFVTPPYHDYHWIAGPETDDRFGDGFTDDLTEAMLALDPADPDDAAVLDGYGAGAFIATSADDYGEIEEIGRKLDLIE